MTKAQNPKRKSRPLDSLRSLRQAQDRPFGKAQVASHLERGIGDVDAVEKGDDVKDKKKWQESPRDAATGASGDFRQWAHFAGGGRRLNREAAQSRFQLTGGLPGPADGGEQDPSLPSKNCFLAAESATRLVATRKDSNVPASVHQPSRML